jgi:hypothetical protein
MRDGLRCAPYIGGAWHYLESTATVAIGQWQHIACTYDGAAVAIHVNGREVGALPATGTFGTTALLPVGIGAGFDEASNSQNENTMLVSDVRIYNRALSQAELAALSP